jgi:hypothetical protein
MTCRDAIIKADEQDPVIKSFLTSFRGICDALLSGGNPQLAIVSGMQKALESWAQLPAAQLAGFVVQLQMQQMQASQPPSVAGGMGATPPGQPGGLQTPPGMGLGPSPGAAAPTPQPGPGMGSL